VSLPYQPGIACAVLTMAMLLPAGGVSAAGPGATSVAETAASLLVPGGASALADAAGVDPSIPRARVLLTVIRALYELPDGLSAAADARRQRFAGYLKRLSEYLEAGPLPGGDIVPLPLPEAAWSKVPDAAPGRRGFLLERIVGNRSTALAYYGLSAVDEQTRAFLAASPEALQAVFDPPLAAVLATCGGSLHVIGTRVDVPGGEAAVPLWEDLVGRPVTRPSMFIAKLLEKDLGRAALLYEAVAHLDGPAQSFALGLSEPDLDRRKARFRALYQASAAPLLGWSPQTRPFDRVVFDAAQVLSQLLFLSNGRPAGPESRGFWEAAFATARVPAQTGRPNSDSAARIPVDAAWLIEQLSVTDTTLRRQRAEGFAFAQRVFPTPAAASLPDVLVAVRGLSRFSMLVLTLERMGIDSPVTYSQAVRTADAISRAGKSRSWATLTQFQAALAVIERMRFARAVDVSTADALVRSLCAVPLTTDGEYLGAVAPWLESLLLRFEGPLARDVGGDRPDRPVETRLLALISGAVASSPFGDSSRMPTIEWEGLQYRVDPAGATLRRLQDVRDVMGGPSFDAVLTLAGAAGALPGTANPAQALARVEAAASALGPPQPADTPGRRSGTPDMRELLSTARRLFRDDTRTSNPASVGRTVDDVPGAAAWRIDMRRATDWYLASVLSSIVYAPHVGGRGSVVLLGGDPSALHDFGLGEVDLGISALAPWRRPVEVRDRGVGWHLRGSLLGLDVALGRFALRRVSTDEVPPAPRLTDVERQALTEPVVLLSPFDQSEAGRDQLVAALDRGLARLADAYAPSGALLKAASAVGLDEWRMQMLPWMREHERERIAELWSLAEIVRLGVDDPANADNFDAFGSSMWSVRGQLACRFPWRQPWTTFAGRKGVRVVAGLMPDLAIMVAKSLATLKLPARLSVGVLAVVTQEMLDTVRVDHDDDWLALVGQARRLASRSFEDYVAALTYDGPLIPILQEPGDGTRR
jgi:hypothetical protein